MPSEAVDRWTGMRGAFGRLSGNTRGSAWLMISAIAFTAMTVLIKLLQGYSAPVQALYSQLASLLLMVPLVARSRGKVLVLNGVWMQLGRSLSAAVGVTLAYYAVQELPLADANAISFTRALWIGPLAMVMLRDRIAPGTWVALLVGFGGVLIIARPTAATPLGWAHVAAIVSAFCLALSVTGIKLLTRRNSVGTIMVWSAIMGVALMVPAAAGTWRWPEPFDFMLLSLLGAMSVVTSGAYIYGMALGDAATLAVVDYVRLPMAIIAGIFVFGEVPGAWTLVGSAIVVGTAIWAALSDRRAAAIEPAAPA